MRTLVIANPRSGRSRGLGAAEKAARAMASGGWDVTVRATGSPGDGVRLAQEAARQGFDAVFACGGDGTLSQVVTGLLDTGIPAGLIPAGTGNDFARTVGLSRDPVEAARQALGGHARAVDLLEANGGVAWSLNVMGVGFDAAVAARMNRRLRLTGGAFAYVTAVVQELTFHRATEVVLAVDGEIWRGQALLVAIANAQSYGGGMRIAPLASVDDSLLDVVLVEAFGRLEFARSFPRVFRGAHLTHPAVRTWQGREVTLTTPQPCPVLVDGDLMGETPLMVRVSPRRALLWLP
ncbi:MAG: diacylglycerol kinase family lipid kinase [Armatimonadetes bacterium]|nr:diacylglycerol kinase family lipid kinase [Armatimonadota bacterium]